MFIFISHWHFLIQKVIVSVIQATEACVMSPEIACEVGASAFAPNSDALLNATMVQVIVLASWLSNANNHHPNGM